MRYAQDLYTVVDDPNLSAILEAYTEAYRPYPLYMPLPPGVRSVRRTGGRMPFCPCIAS